MSAAPQINPLLQFEIEVVKGPHQGLKLSFQKESITIGRGVDNDVVLSEDLRISRQHAEIIQSHGYFKFRNVNAKNYTLQNGIKNENGPLKSNDVLALGESEVVFRNLQAMAANGNSPGQKLQIVSQAPNPVQQPTAAAPKSLQGQPSSSAPILRQQQKPAHQYNPIYPPNGFQQQSYQGAQQPPPGYRGPSRGAPSSGGENKFRFYLILGVVGLALYFFVFQGASSGRKAKKIRGGEEIELAVQQSEENIKSLEERLGERNTVTSKRAEENFIKGFRDYQKGQYLRAREYFQIVLNLSPSHVEARKYYELSKIKFDKQIDYNFIEGLKNKDKKNYRMCRSYFSQVLILIQNDRMHPKYDEAQRYLRECSLSLERRF